MSEESTKPKKPRGPAKTAAQKLSELVEAKRKQVQRLSEKHAEAACAERTAYGVHKSAADELCKLEDALEKLS